MPLVTSPTSPWESYPFRQQSVSSTTGSIPLTGNPHGSISNVGQPSHITSHSKLNSQPPFRDLTMSPNSRNSINSGSTMVNSRGSLSSLGSIGTISSRASMASVGSLPSLDGTVSSAGTGSETALNLWQHDDGPSNTPISSKASMGAGPGIGAPISLSVSGLPRDLSVRECHYIFALASDLLSVEMNRNAVSGDVTVSAKFNTLHGAQQTNQLLERRTDLFGLELKTSIQSYTSPFVSQTNTPRSIYPSRPLFADSYWTQQPGTPLSPSAGGSEFYSGSRRQSLISPTETVYPANSVGHASVGSSTSLHQSHGDNSQTSTDKMSPPVTAAATPTVAGSTSSSPSSSSILSSNSGPASASAIGTGVPLSNSAPSTASGSGLSHRPSISSLAPSSAQHVQSHSQQNQSNNQPHLGLHNNVQSQSLMDQSSSYSHSQQHYNGDSQKIPPPNPADQNPPCNTLYVGNLPPDTSESELKDLFSQQTGYRRLCFRTKQNGPMCFVEFEDERFAGRALTELYGHVLSNSVKGGIRLSYSKNPLGVRSRSAKR